MAECFEEANHRLLENNGIKRGYQKEKNDGTYVRPAHVTLEFLKTEGVTYFMQTLKEWFYDKYGEKMFEQEGATEKLLDILKGKRVLLRQYPEIIRAMFKGRESDIPEDLRIEENTHKS